MGSPNEYVAGRQSMAGDNNLARRRYSSANDLTEPLVSASSDAHCLPAVKGLERVRLDTC